MSHGPGHQGKARPRIERFLSKDPTEATSVTGPQLIENVNANLNFASIGKTDFYLQPPVDGDEVWVIYRMILMIVDSQVRSERYGNINLKAGIGVDFNITDYDDHLIVNLTPLKVKSNAQWGNYCFDAVPHNYGSGDQYVIARWSFLKGSPFAIELRPGDKFKMTFEDDFRGLISHTFFVEGWRVQVNPELDDLNGFIFPGG